MLSSVQLTTLHSLMDRIIPPDDDAGAWDAGVGTYLARQFDRDLRDYLETYQLGLDALEAEARASAQQSFAALPAAEQDALLRRIEVGAVVQQWPTDPAKFFQAVVQHVVEGYYSDPGNGGNRDGVAWHMIGFLPGRREGAQS
jgi:hypothetical protein